jgi:hypothetical protein
VRFFWRQDEQGNIRVYGVHTGEGTPYEGVRTANMVWNSEHNRYEFTPAHGADGPLITWTPENLKAVTFHHIPAATLSQ